MLISYNWLKSLLGADPGPGVVAERLTAAGLPVDAVRHVGANLRDVAVARVVSSRPHPTSKNPLTLVTIDRGDGGGLEVVCGAPNVPPPGGLVAFAPVGATVFGKGAVPFTLEAKPVAGVVSAGMLCAEDELGIGVDHAGILVLDGVTPGARLADLAGLEDHILEVDVTPNRGDALSHVGVARDVAALFGLPFAPPEPDAPSRVVPGVIHDHVAVRVDDPARCPRYAAALVRDVALGPSPLWLRARLHRLGVRPISNVVDVTNLVMLEFGQPLHAFDLAQLAERTIVVRRAREGESMATLDGIARALAPDDLVIADGRGAVAIAGVMGGERSGITDATRDVVLECAAFDPRGVRRTARRLGLHTESSHRFERGTDVGMVPDVLATAAAHLTRLARGAAVGGTIDVYAPPPPRRITLRPSRVDAVLGVAVPHEASRRVLVALGCEVQETGADALEVTLPGHRNDLAREVDLVEEVGRVWGFDRIPGTLPPSRGARAGARRDWHVRRRLRAALCAMGLDEAISYVFVAPREVEALGFDAARGVRLANPLSEERSILRPSLLPKLAAAVGHARRHGEARVRLFEVGSVFAPPGADATLPVEETRVAVALAGPRDAYLTRAGEVDFYDLKGIVEELALQLTGAEATFDRDDAPSSVPPWAHPRAYARVRVAGRDAGVIAALHPDVVGRAELGRSAVVGELDAAAFGVEARAPRAKAPPRFPVVRRDVALAVAKRVPAGAIAQALAEFAGTLCESVALFDRYEGKELAADTHSLAFTLTFRADDRTLQDAEVEALAEAAVAGARAKFGAAQR